MLNVLLNKTDNLFMYDWHILSKCLPLDVRIFEKIIYDSWYSHKTRILSQLEEWEGRKEGNILFYNILNTFCIQLYGVRHGKGLFSKRGNLLPPHGLLFLISTNSSKGSFICTISQTG